MKKHKNKIKAHIKRAEAIKARREKSNPQARKSLPYTKLKTDVKIIQERRAKKTTKDTSLIYLRGPKKGEVKDALVAKLTKNKTLAQSIKIKQAIMEYEEASQKGWAQHPLTIRSLEVRLMNNNMEKVFANFRMSAEEVATQLRIIFNDPNITAAWVTDANHWDGSTLLLPDGSDYTFAFDYDGGVLL